MVSLSLWDVIIDKRVCPTWWKICHAGHIFILDCNNSGWLIFLTFPLRHGLH